MSTYPTDPQEAAADIARQLNETTAVALHQLRRIIERLGVEATYAVLEETLRLEAEGGVMQRNGKKRRTPGGAFFSLVRDRIPAEDRRYIWPRVRQPRKPGGADGQPAKAAKPSRPLLNWSAGLAELPELLTKEGNAMTVKLTLVGRPGKVIDKGDVILTTMSSQKVPALPKGLPEPPDDPTIYLLFIARKQWQKVAVALEENAEDKLIVEGYPVLDKGRGVIAVLAQNATTVGLQRAKKQPNPQNQS
jgi:hypothetical protein